MAPARLKLSAVSLVGANLVPLAGVVFWQWSVSSIVILYWFENVVIGLINVARMLMFAPAESSLAAVVGVPRARASVLGQAVGHLNVKAIAYGIKFFMIPFFIIHYFMFCAGHGIFIFAMFEDQAGYFPEPAGMELIGTLWRAVDIFATPLAVAAAVLALSHVVSFLVNYIGGGEYRRLDLQRLMMMPYGRIVVLHLTIIFGGMATMALGEPIWVLVILVILKIGVDLKMHVREHVKAAGTET